MLGLLMKSKIVPRKTKEKNYKAIIRATTIYTCVKNDRGSKLRPIGEENTASNI